jgi:hypothetical protein
MFKIALGIASWLILQNSAMAIFDVAHQGDAFRLINQDLGLDASTYANTEQMSETAWNNIVRTQSSKSCRLDIEKIEHIYGERKGDKIVPRVQQEEAYHVVANEKMSHIEFFDYKKGPFFYKKTEHFNFRISQLGGGRRVIPSTFNLGGVEIPSLDYFIWQDNLFTNHTTDKETKEQTKEIQESCVTCRYIGVISTPLEKFISENIIPSFKRFFNEIDNTFSNSHMERSLLKVSVDMSTGSLLAISTVKTKGPTHYTHVPRAKKRVETNCIIPLDDYASNTRLLILQAHLQNENSEKSKDAIEAALKQNVPPQSIITTLTSNDFGIELLNKILPGNRELLVGFFDRYKLFNKSFIKDVISLARDTDLSDIPSLDTFLATDFNSYSSFLLDIVQENDWPKFYITKNYKRLDKEQKKIWFIDLIGNNRLDREQSRKLYEQYASPLYASNKEFSDAMMMMAEKDYISHKEMVNKTYKFLGGNWPKDFTKFIPKDVARDKIERELLNNESSLGMAKLYFEIAYGEDSIDSETISDFYQVSDLTPIQEYKLLKDHPVLAEDMMIEALNDPTVSGLPIHASRIFENLSNEQRLSFLDNQLHRLIEETPKRLSAYNRLITKLDSFLADQPEALIQLRSFLAEQIVSGLIDIDEKSSPIFSASFLRDEFINEFTDTPHFKKAVELGNIKFLPADDPMLIAGKIMKAYPRKNISAADYEIVKDYQDWLSYQEEQLTSEEDKAKELSFSQYVQGLKTSLINQAETYNFKTFDELLNYAENWKDEYQSFDIKDPEDLIPFHNTVAKILWKSQNWKLFLDEYLDNHELLGMMFIENSLAGHLSNIHHAEVYELLTLLAKDYPFYKDDNFLETYMTHYLTHGVPKGREQQFIDLLKKNKSKVDYILAELSVDEIDHSIKNYIYPDTIREKISSDINP